jgi:hypothetical protein
MAAFSAPTGRTAQRAELSITGGGEEPAGLKSPEKAFPLFSTLKRVPLMTTWIRCCYSKESPYGCV